ncbi:MAG: hypothetical protein V1664_01470 [Candidatus Uhrbacteria bacterium]
MSALLKNRRPITKNRELETSLRDIYGDESTLDMTRIERKKSSRLTAVLWRLIGGLFFLTLISWGGFIWWQANPTSSGQPLKINITAPKNLTSGAATCFQVNYENTERVPIAALSVSLNLPKTFTLKEAKPAATAGNNWTLSPLGPGSDGLIEVCGTFKSLVPGSEKIQAVFTYRPANFSSDFQDIVSTDLTVDKSIFSLESTGPTEIVVGDPITYSVKIKNTDLEKTEGLRLRAVLPESFTTTLTEPTLAEIGGAPFWDIVSLEPNAEQTFSLTGSFTSSASGLVPIIFELGFLSTDNSFIKQNETKIETNVIGGELNFGLIINGSDKNQTADPGERLRLSLTYTNRGQQTMAGVSFSLELVPNGKTLPIDFSLSDLAGGTKSGSAITWNSANISALTSLASNAQGTIDPVLVLNKPINPETMADNFSLQIKATINKIGNTTTTRTISSTPIIISLNSNAALTTEARYYDADGAPLGSGPLPPKVGETTIYRLFWTISNSLHDLKNSSVTMTLPVGVAWTNNLEAGSGNLTFNETTKQISWKIDSLSKNTTSTSCWFDVAITPTTKDVSSFFQLANPTAFEATDAVTNDLVHGSTDALTTAVPNDDFASGKGVVE